MDPQDISRILISQYTACLNTLRTTISKVPADQWNSNEYKNPNWQILYHTIWATKLYLGPNSESYEAFENAIEAAERLGGSEEWEKSDTKLNPDVFHSKEELINYINLIEQTMQQSIKSLSLEENAGFPWYPFSRLELHIMNIRHIQHHTAQIIERLKLDGISGFPWQSNQSEAG